MPVLSRPRSREHGATATEFALILPLLVMLTFGLIEFGVFLWNLTQTQTSVAAAVRTAGTQARVDGYEDQIADLVQASMRSSTARPKQLVVYRADPASGRPTGLAAGATDYATCASSCWVYTWNAGLRSWTKAAAPSWPAAQQKACGSRADTDFVGVWLNMRFTGVTGIGLAQRDYVTKGVARLEPVPVATGRPCKP